MSDRTVVVMPNWVGDCVMAAPVVAALADSGRRVTVLARKPLLPLLALFRGVDETMARSDDETCSEALAAEGFGEAVVLPNSFRSARLVSRAGISRRFGYRGNFRAPLLAPPVARPRGRRAQVEDYRELLAAMRVDEPESWVPEIALGDELRARGRERLERARLTASGSEAPLVGLSPGAEWGPSKRWPMKRWGDLAIDLRRRIPGVRQAIFVGPKEIWLGVRVHEESGKLHPVIGPDLDLAGLAGVLAHLDLLVTNDSGPMHLAAALGVPCVALFGPTDRRRTAPAGAGHVVLDLELWCSPCFRKRCPLLHHNCLRGLGVNAVAEAAVAALAAAR
jgi:heptosyltransferase-2